MTRAKYGALLQPSRTPREPVALKTYSMHIDRFGLESAEEMAEWVVDHYGVSSGSDYPTMLDGTYTVRLFCIHFQDL